MIRTELTSPSAPSAAAPGYDVARWPARCCDTVGQLLGDQLASPIVASLRRRPDPGPDAARADPGTAASHNAEWFAARLSGRNVRSRAGRIDLRQSPEHRSSVWAIWSPSARHRGRRAERESDCRTSGAPSETSIELPPARSLPHGYPAPGSVRPLPFIAADCPYLQRDKRSRRNHGDGAINCEVTLFLRAARRRQRHLTGQRQLDRRSPATDVGILRTLITLRTPTVRQLVPLHQNTSFACPITSPTVDRCQRFA